MPGSHDANRSLYLYRKENNDGREPEKCNVMIHQRLLSRARASSASHDHERIKCQQPDSDTILLPVLSVIR